MCLNFLGINYEEWWKWRYIWCFTVTYCFFRHTVKGISHSNIVSLNIRYQHRGLGLCYSQTFTALISYLCCENSIQTLSTLLLCWSTPRGNILQHEPLILWANAVSCCFTIYLILILSIKTMKSSCAVFAAAAIAHKPARMVWTTPCFGIFSSVTNLSLRIISLLHSFSSFQPPSSTFCRCRWKHSLDTHFLVQPPTLWCSAVKDCGHAPGYEPTQRAISSRPPLTPEASIGAETAMGPPFVRSKASAFLHEDGKALPPPRGLQSAKSGAEHGPKIFLALYLWVTSSDTSTVRDTWCVHVWHSESPMYLTHLFTLINDS